MDSNIITGQFVQISQTPASIWSRIAARLIDLFILSIYIYAVSSVMPHVATVIEIIYGSSDVWLFWVILLLTALPAAFYSPIMEMLAHGRTIGKMALGLRVVMADGTTPTLGALLLRWALLPVDLYLTSGAGALFIIFTKNHQRLGDLAAGTMVIKKSDYHDVLVGLDEFSHISRNYQPHYPEAAHLSQGQVDIISRVVEDYNVNNDYDERRVTALAQKVKETLNIQSQEKSDLTFLLTLLKDYQYFLLEIV